MADARRLDLLLDARARALEGVDDLIGDAFGDVAAPRRLRGARRRLMSARVSSPDRGANSSATPAPISDAEQEVADSAAVLLDDDVWCSSWS